MNQIVLGASIPFAIALLIYLCRRGRGELWFFVTVPILMGLGAVWAVVPDIPRLLGNQELYFKWMRDPRTNIFFFHYTIDQTESDSPWWGLAFLAMATALMLAALRKLHQNESPSTEQ